MQYLVSVIANGTESAKPGEDAAIDAFNDRLRAQGYWVFGNGLAEPSAATVIDGRGEGPVLTDGPFLESKEHPLSSAVRGGSGGAGLRRARRPVPRLQRGLFGD